MAWRLRRVFWNWLLALKFRHAKPRLVPVPGVDRPITPVPFTSQFPSVPIAGIVVADHVPADERQTLPLLFCRLQAWLYRAFSPMRAGLGEIDADPRAALDAAYPASHRRLYRAPQRPREYEDGVDIGRLAVASPYACYLQADDAGTYRWDFTGLDGFECHAGLLPPASVVEFAVDASDGLPHPVRIDCELGSCKPGEPDWADARRLALCAVTTHLSLVRHFNWLHLVCGAPLAFVTQNQLPVRHPVRRLLQPHVYDTQSSNQMVSIVQMTPGGDFENLFSFTHDGVCALFEATCRQFDLRMVEPDLDARRRAVAGLPSPALDNRRALMKVIRDHVARYMALYYGSDAVVAEDESLRAWLEHLAVHVPGGVTEIAGSPPTWAGMVTLLSTLVYLTTVEHEIVGSGVWDYQPWSDVQPVRVQRSGRRQPLDVYQRLVNANFNLNVHRTPLMGDFSAMALDRAGAAAFRQFRLDLAVLQAAMDREPASCWRLEPKRLKANINA